MAESSDGDTAETRRALFEGNEDALELAVVSTVATLIPTIRMDDHESIREMTRQPWCAWAIACSPHAIARRPFSCAKNETPALAILDVVMPKMGGLAAATKLAERFPALRVLLTSGYSAAAGAIPAESAALRYLQKPYSPTALAHVVREILGPASHVGSG